MNILPKKRWHVRTKDNIARVRRDEAEAAEKEKERIDRAKLAEKEARTAYLRNNARQKYDGSGSADPPSRVCGPAPRPINPPKTEIEADIYTTQGNINFFKDVEEGKQAGSATNKEHEAEKKAEQEKYEKSIGYLTYLGQDSGEAGGGRAWYEQESGKVIQREAIGEKIDSSDIGEVGLKTKSKMDPIHDIIKYGGFKSTSKDKQTPKKCVSTAITTVVVKEDKKDMIKSDNSLDKVHNGQKPELKTKKHQKKHKKESKRSRKEKKKSHKRKHRSYSDKTESAKEESRHNSTSRQSCMKRKRRDCDSSAEEDERQQVKRRKMSKSKKGKDRKRRQSSSSSRSSSNCSSSPAYSSEDEAAAQEKKKKLEKLREERLKREAEERRRAERLLAGKEPDKVEENKGNKPAFVQKYNSQYNPHIARQNQEPTTLQAGVKYWL
ncbi:hypothetical protein Pcinc_037488 [Petrolisthes cinctipes]|uniref:CBF1-interacting co-repressor CIR N-terminal domain-containing protein n=1 Tax=Petrolisthes cinctipes TaxID=88211 RepID=A0AAE1ELH4_PETCI|nr:hypothetical protein Pcinc_037488 [Petrolisthes cinctipes]